MSKDFLESLVTDDQESAYSAFESSINDKLSDALEVRRVEIASSIMDIPMVEEEVDPQELAESEAARELVLHADNDEQLYRSSHQPIIKNLARKKAKGIYDHEKAIKLWGYHADRAAQSYHKAHGSANQKWHHMFSKADRMKAAKQFADQGRDELEEALDWNTIRDMEDGPEKLKATRERKQADVRKKIDKSYIAQDREARGSKVGGNVKFRESVSKKANRENDQVNEYVVLPAISQLKSAGDMERDKTKRYAKYNKAIRCKDGLPKKKKVNEVAAPGQEEWIKANKKRFIARYGKEKGTKILYAKAWKMANEAAEPQTKPAAGPSNAALHRNVSANLRRAIQTLKIKGVNPSIAASAHKDFGKLVAKNPKAPGHMLLRKLSAQKAQSVQQLSQAGVPMGQSLEADPQEFNQLLTRMKRFR